jgi:hypothetical protein
MLRCRGAEEEQRCRYGGAEILILNRCRGAAEVPQRCRGAEVKT